MFFMMFHRLICTHFCITFWMPISIMSFYLSLTVISRRIFRTLRNLDNYKYRTRKPNTAKVFLPIPKYLMTQLAKLPNNTLSLNTAFQHCQNNSDYFLTRAYILVLCMCSCEMLYHINTNPDNDPYFTHQSSRNPLELPWMSTNVPCS